MKEAFRNGIVRSGLYLEAIRTIFHEFKLPEELIYLPHVESSFYPHACSKYNAVGLWQFTKTTGRQFLIITNDVDERRDPFLSSVAAAKLLQSNFKSLKNWPLAVMAYNHGLSGISRAVRRLNTKDPVKIIRNYSSRRFGFASRNFYAEFLAAVQVAQSHEMYFGKLKLDEPLRFRTQILLAQQDLNTILKKYRISDEQLKKLNPALRSPVFRGEKPVPKDYPLRIPKRPLDLYSRSFTLDEKKGHRSRFSLPLDPEKTATLIFNKLKQKGWIPDLKKNNPDSLSQQTSRYGKNGYRDTTLFCWADANKRLSLSGNFLIVQSEETLGHYADWLEIPTQALRRLNGLKYGEVIHVGQRLYLSFQKVSKESFFQRRMAYHRTIRESFFNRHTIQGKSVYQVKQGETLWTVMLGQSYLPLWLLAACNEGKDLDRLHPGQTLIIPQITKVESSASQ
jgi:membrane-bound lytic murein transglycosylase D